MKTPEEAAEVLQCSHDVGGGCRELVSDLIREDRASTPNMLSFSLDQAKELVEQFGGDEDTEISVTEETEAHSGPGLYAHVTDYPDEGSTLLGPEPAPKKSLKIKTTKDVMESGEWLVPCLQDAGGRDRFKSDPCKSCLMSGKGDSGPYCLGKAYEEVKEYKRFWVSWYGKNGCFELHYPWWISGEMETGHQIFCAAVLARDEEHARKIVEQVHDEGEETQIEWRFVEARDATWSPFGERFPAADWMKWPENT